MTSITASKMNEVGLVSVLRLRRAKAAGAPEHREHLQTESNEAADHTAARPPRANQFGQPLMGPENCAASYFSPIFG